MKCGFFELDITPCLGSIIPGGFAARYADEILDKLYVRAVVIKNGNKKLALAVIDACGITKDITDEIRKSVSLKSSIEAHNIMIMATHTHGGGPTLNWGEEVVRDENYLRFIAERTADAIILADKNAKESEFYKGKEEICDISFIRIYKMKGNRMKTNPTADEYDEILEPYTTIDPELLVLAVKQNEKFVGAIVNFATHPATVSDNRVTGDYISVLCKELKNIYGPDFVTVFINGACGNINHVNPFDQNTFAADRYKTVGITIAQKVSGAIKNAELMLEDSLDCDCKSIDIRFRKPDEKQLIEAKRLFDSLGDGLIDCTPSKQYYLDYMDTFFALQTFWIMADKRTQRSVDLQVFKIGSCYVVGTPVQLFCEYGKKIKANCNDMCFVSAFANDYCGYVPVPECMREGVYEARLATTSALEADAGDKITAEVTKMLGEFEF